MFTVIYSLIQYIKAPNCAPLQVSKNEKFVKLIQLLFISLIVSFALGLLISILATTGAIDIDSHAITKLLAKKSKTTVFLMAVIAAPILEELLFRAPINLFCDFKYFKFIFYGFALTFGFMHIVNYEISTTILLLSPILIAPQIALGLILGYTRIKLGLIYAIILHMLFNSLLIIPNLLFMETIK